MALGRLVRTAIKIAPVAYPIIRKAMQKRKSGSSGQQTTTSKKR